MPDPNAIADRYVDTWNETDTARRAALIAEHWSAGATYADPMSQVAGHEALAGLIDAVQQRYPGHAFARVGKVAAHGKHLRFSWSLAPAGGPVAAIGTDVATLAEDGRLQSVIGFLDQVGGAPV
jgi:SnoaL-like domain